MTVSQILFLRLEMNVDIGVFKLNIHSDTSVFKLVLVLVNDTSLILLVITSIFRTVSAFEQG